MDMLRKPRRIRVFGLRVGGPYCEYGDEAAGAHRKFDIASRGPYCERSNTLQADARLDVLVTSLARLCGATSRDRIAALLNP